MRVQIDSRYPLNITVSAADFGRHFAAMNGMEQTAVLRAMIEEMKPHPCNGTTSQLNLRPRIMPTCARGCSKSSAT